MMLVLAILCAIPGCGPIGLLMNALIPPGSRIEYPELSVADPFRDGTYELESRGDARDNSLHVHYRAANRDRREILKIRNGRETHARDIVLSPSPDGLDVTDLGRTWRVSIPTQELAELGGADGALVIRNRQRNGRLPRWKAEQRPWCCLELLDSLFFLILWIVLVTGGVATTPRNRLG